MKSKSKKRLSIYLSISLGVLVLGTLAIIFRADLATLVSKPDKLTDTLSSVDLAKVQERRQALEENDRLDTSVNRIQAAQAQGKVSEAEGALLAYKALIDPSLLSREYRGKDGDATAIDKEGTPLDSILTTISLNLDKYTDAQKTDLAKLEAKQKNLSVTEVSGSITQLLNIRPNVPNPARPHGSTHFLIHYPIEVEQQRIVDLSQALESAYTTVGLYDGFTAPRGDGYCLDNEGDNRIDVYIYDITSGGYRSMCWNFSKEFQGTYLAIDQELLDFITTALHEFSHAVQDEFWAYQPAPVDPRPWVQEATAEFMELSFYPPYDQQIGDVFYNQGVYDFLATWKYPLIYPETEVYPVPAACYNKWFFFEFLYQNNYAKALDVMKQLFTKGRTYADLVDAFNGSEMLHDYLSTWARWNAYASFLREFTNDEGYYASELYPDLTDIWVRILSEADALTPHNFEIGAVGAEASLRATGFIMDDGDRADSIDIYFEKTNANDDIEFKAFAFMWDVSQGKFRAVPIEITQINDLEYMGQVLDLGTTFLQHIQAYAISKVPAESGTDNFSIHFELWRNLPCPTALIEGECPICTDPNFIGACHYTVTDTGLPSTDGLDDDYKIQAFASTMADCTLENAQAAAQAIGCPNASHPQCYVTELLGWDDGVRGACNRTQKKTCSSTKPDVINSCCLVSGCTYASGYDVDYVYQKSLTPIACTYWMQHPISAQGDPICLSDPTKNCQDQCTTYGTPPNENIVCTNNCCEVASYTGEQDPGWAVVKKLLPGGSSTNISLSNIVSSFVGQYIEACNTQSELGYTCDTNPVTPWTSYGLPIKEHCPAL